MDFLKKKYKRILIIIGVLFLLFWSFPYVNYQILKLENALIDFRFRLKPIQDPPKDIVIVEIDHFSLSFLDTWPWPRSYYTKLLSVLKNHGAKIVGLDIIFDAKSSLGHQEDLAFSEGLKSFEDVILASKRYEEVTGGFSLVSWSIPISILRDVSDYGFVNQVSDIDGKIRKSWLFFEDKDSYRFSFDMKLYAKSLGLNINDVEPDFVSNTILFESDTISFFNNGQYYINYIGEPGSFTTIPFFEVIDETYSDMSIFKDKIVLVGATDPILHDLFFTPYGLMSGVEIHANTLQTLLTQTPISNVKNILDLCLRVAVIALVLLITYRVKPLLAVIFNTAILCSHAVFVSLLFLNFRLLINWSYVLVFSVIGYVTITIFKFVKEEQEKRLIKGMFSQYVAPSIVDTLIKEPDRLKLGGEKRELTVFFSDVRSFTTFSEKYSPEAVVEILNEYLDAMTKCIFKWKGTLDKYVGDEIMAVWGAPLEMSNHAQLALCCCWDQLQVLRDLQRNWISQGREPLDIGMGLNTGEMITGNIGSSIYKDYTVIGDAVNLAARLEGETRNYGTEEEKCYLIISEFTYEKVKDICKVTHLGSVKVKGKTKPVDIYQVDDVAMLECPS